MLNDQGFLAEGSGENLFLIKKGVVYTPPSFSGVLPGITRHSVVTLLREAGVEVVETSLTRTDAYAADEAFFTGTAAEVTPIRMIDHRPVGDGTPGSITRQAQTMYMETVSGKNADHLDWLTHV
jgi:branched-chain amino acid aminotransferase